MNKTIGILAAIIIVGGGLLFFLGNKSSQETPQTTQEDSTMKNQESVQETPMNGTNETTTEYTLDEVSRHTSASDCWMAVEGIVYDVTPYIADQMHPGGAEILKGCGKDATELYNNRPHEGGPHSANARELLQNFKIGTLAH